MFEKIKYWWVSLPDKKRYIEFITALLTVPVLLTVLISNINSLNSNQKNTKEPVPTPPIITIIQKENQTPTPNITPTPIATATPVTCNNTVGPVEITNPNENQIIYANPISIDITYNQGSFCAVVWSYRINGGPWSDFTDKSISIFNLSPGVKNLEVQVKSIASGKMVLLHRNFTVADLTPTATPVVSTNSASLQE
jgi:hypothetical protein